MTIAVAPESNFTQVTARLRPDQKTRLELESRARGVPVADVLRDNLDLSFAIKEEMAQIVEGEFDGNDPRNAPRLVHALLFRLEERILAALDSMALRLENCRPAALFPKAINTASPDTRDNEAGAIDQNRVAQTINEFIALIAEGSSQSAEVWTGAFLEIVARLELVGTNQLRELEYKGEVWLQEHGYYQPINGAERVASNNLLSS